MTEINNKIVQKLQTAHYTQEPTDFNRNHYDLDESTAYSIQEQFVKEKCDQTNEGISGYKISMTSPDTQAFANTDEPAYGTYTEGNLVHSLESISIESLFEPLIEPELRSEEHTSELQSRFDLVCRLLLEKKKKE